MDNLDINVKLEPVNVTIPEEQPKEISLSMVPQQEEKNETQNSTSATTASTATATNDCITATILTFLGGMAVCAIVAVSLFGIPRNSVANGDMPDGMTEDANEISVADTQKKISCNTGACVIENIIMIQMPMD
jgi:hypothetical protein